MNNLCMSAEQIVRKPVRRPRVDFYPHSPTAGAQAFPASDSAQSTVAQPFFELSRIPGHIISCYYFLKI
jgi:hypothetical protein